VKPSDVADWIRRPPRLKVLDVGGNRESREPGIGERVLAEVLPRLAEGS
jgi:hypothetical protein